MELSENVQNLFFVLEYTGVALAATVGGTVAKRMHFDVIGFAFIAMISSLSGGMLRDALLNDAPAAALTNPGYLITATIGAAVAYTVNLGGRVWDKFRFYADVITIGVWAVAGTIKGLSNGLGWVACVLLAIITAVGGTLMRDVVLRRIPSLFTEQKMYVLPAIVSSLLLLGFNHFGMLYHGMLASAAAAPILAMVVYFGGNYLRRGRMPERPLEARIGQALGVEDDPDEPHASAENVVAALDSASDEQLLQAVRVLLRNEVKERSEAKA
ncbi:TRIC cation channel family protein [Corynebacterium sp. Q4381]|uniref:trimeric intracellular cation channel family protein n=1 Tax=Corynebacterium sp. Marseille-Q4381 TaxID=3121597 RepID=UPI002FE5B5FA